MSRSDLSELAWMLSVDGFAGHHDAIDEIVRTARARGVSPVLVDVLGDPGEPEIARLRALGRVAVLLAADPERIDRRAA